MSDAIDSGSAAGGAVPPLKPDVPGTAQGAGAKEARKTPARPPEQVRADLVVERAALGASFEALRADLDEAVDSGKERLSAAGRRARIVGPAVGAVLAAALILRSRSRRRR